MLMWPLFPWVQRFLLLSLYCDCQCYWLLLIFEIFDRYCRMLAMSEVVLLQCEAS